MRWGWPVALMCALAAPSLPASYAQEEDHPPRASAGGVLVRWERASAGLLGVGPLEHRRLYHLHGSKHSAHEIAVLNEFRGPVSAEDLMQRFEWSLVESLGETVLLGKPTDEVERMFYEELIVAIDAETNLPTSVRFMGPGAGNNWGPLSVVLSPRVLEPNRFSRDPNAKPLQVASRDQDVPQGRSPIRLVEYIAREPRVRPALPSDVEHALKVLETAAGEVRSLHANVRRYSYEAQSHVEHRAVGELTYTAPTTLYCTLKPAPIDPHAVSHRKGPGGAAYELLPSPAEYWQYTPAEIRFSYHAKSPRWVLSLTDNNPKPVRIDSPKNDQRSDEETVIPPWPMLFHANAAALAERFDIRVSDQQHVVIWDFTPRRSNEWGRFRLMRVLIEKTNHLPQAAQFISPAGDTETVYTFHYTQVQKRKPLGKEPEVLPIKPPAPKLDPAPTDLHGQP